MPASPLVSVIIPCYNVARYVDKAVGSILKQTHENLEIWLVDDASIDDTLNRLKAIRDPRVQIFLAEKNTQKIGAVNEVLAKVTGDFIAFQDADDWSEPGRIEQQLNAFAKDKALGICFTNYFYEGDRHGVPGPVAMTDAELRDEFLHFMRRSNIQLTATCCPSMMISRQALDTTGGYNAYFKGRVAEDIHWIYRILKSFKGITLGERLYHYAVRTGSLTGLQVSGQNAKAAYSWRLLEKIIYKDVHQNIDVLSGQNETLLKQLELEACEAVLLEKMKLLNDMGAAYQKSWSYRVGNFLLKPVSIIKKLIQ